MWLAVTCWISWHVMWCRAVCTYCCIMLHYINHSIGLYQIWFDSNIGYHGLPLNRALHVCIAYPVVLELDHLLWYHNVLCRILCWIYVSYYMRLWWHIIGCHSDYGMPRGLVQFIFICYGIVLDVTWITLRTVWYHSGISLLIICFDMIAYHVIAQCMHTLWYCMLAHGILYGLGSIHTINIITYHL